MTHSQAPKTADNIVVRYFKEFGVLKETRMEYWGLQIVNFLDSMFYFAMITVASMFLSKDLGFNDKDAGYTITLFTSATTLMLLFSGAATDWLGIRKSITICMSAMLMLRIGIVFVGLNAWLPNRGIIATVLLVMTAPFQAGIQTSFQAATARFTTRRSRSAGFNLWYLFSNLGGVAAGLSVDTLRVWLKIPNANTHVFTMGVVTTTLCLVATTALIRREEQLVSPDDPPEEAKSEKNVERKSPLTAMKEMFAHSALWRLIALITLILGVRAVFLYFYLIMPKYWERTIGTDANIGLLTAINPIGVVAGLILLIPIISRFPVFKMLIYGGMITSIALLPMAVPWNIYPWSIETNHYTMAILAMILVTIGEVIWSPRLNEYTAAIAPKGQEGAYMGFSMIPWFAAKTGVSLLSGHLLARWSPETVKIAGQDVPLKQAMVAGQLDYWHRPEAMWLFLGLYAVAGCLVAWMLRNWFESATHRK
ncbi:MAG: MFS transporter [Verrucomicrobiota bacterium]